MKIDYSEQQTDEHFAAKRGKPSASMFDKIITKTLKASTQAKDYANMLLAEEIMGESAENFKSYWMARGNEMEEEARSMFSFETDLIVDQVGFIFNDDTMQYGCSPDGLIFCKDNPDKLIAGVEIKCPAPHTHIEYLLSGGVPDKYVHQVQGSMYVTGLESWYFVSYHPDSIMHIAEIKKDEKWHEAFKPMMDKLLQDLYNKRIILNNLGMNKTV